MNFEGQELHSGLLSFVQFMLRSAYDLMYLFFVQEHSIESEDLQVQSSKCLNREQKASSYNTKTLLGCFVLSEIASNTHYPAFVKVKFRNKSHFYT